MLIISNLKLSLLKYFNPLLSVDNIIFAALDKCLQRIVAGITWPPEPPVEIKKFFFILTYSSFS